ncbi:methyl-accepting chemotaxis protein [Elstera cyanobacteriorum]|uniref:methyl-accepting chemotaxis protein n=1 Tax=Elstera cyanobacteriorum TaxID=2022747 RepID=UPI00235740E4|nr:methyl-accepting chemotaxis protein [Elstera cyanobacteriorum]MCK6443041.1 methyl-accepting chemotaxis protein [Elstera cyanobacteriorum]
MRAWRHSLVWKIALPVPLALLAMILAIGFIIPRQIEADTQATAVENALQTIAQFRSVRDYYNTAIVPKIRGSQDLKLTHLHANDPKGAPIPATFMLDMSARLQDKGVSLSFYSPYPFPERANRQTDAFQKAAWEQFQKNPDTPFIDRTVLNGKEVVRVAVGDRLGEACVACHNSHPQSPKKDWKVGDVRGVFEIQTVIDAQLARGHMLTYSVLGVVLLGGLAVLIVSLWATRTVARPLLAMGGAVARLAGGERRLNLSREAARADEIGGLARALEGFGTALEQQEAREAAEREEMARKAARQAELESLTQSFDSAVSSLLGKVNGMTDQLHRAAGTMTSTVQQANSAFTAIASSTDQTHANVEATAGAAEELLASNAEIAGRVREALTISRNAVAETETVDRQIASLTETVERIGMAGQLINEIAAQTNLLALNATIEAARAGDAGKGFAVVASEVKALAAQTARATEEIAAQIAAVRSGTSNAAGAVREVGHVIQSLERLAADISGSVEQQGAATSEIARQMQEAANGTRAVAEEMNAATGTVDQARQASATVHDSAANLNSESQSLRGTVEKFLAGVRMGAR